jgi:hypothetical protein
MRLTSQQSLPIAELPEDSRVVGRVDGRSPPVRKPIGQLSRIQQSGCLIAATIAAKRRLTDRRAADAS